MKQITTYSMLLLLFAGISSCKKDPTDYLDGTKVPSPVYHISFYDHKTGDKITGLEAALIGISSNPFNGNLPTGGLTVKSDANGAFNFTIPNGIIGNRYLKISTQVYVEALYEVNEYTDPATNPVHTMEGSGGPNVVYAKLLRKEGNDFYFRADLYRKTPLDIHIMQLRDYPDSVKAFFNANIIGSDPSNTANYFGFNVLQEGIALDTYKKIDTTIRVYGFGDYLNKVSWSVYSIADNGYVVIGRKFISTGDLPEKILSSDTPSSITITF